MCPQCQADVSIIFHHFVSGCHGFKPDGSFVHFGHGRAILGRYKQWQGIIA